MVSIKLLLVDDHVVVRQALRRILDLQPGMFVVGEAGNGQEAIDQAEALHPDVVLMDAAMPGLGGIEATRRLLKKVPATRVVVLSQHTDQTTVAEALEAGAIGFMTKTDGLEELGRAIRAAASDKHYLSPELSGFLVRSYLEGPPVDSAGGADGAAGARASARASARGRARGEAARTLTERELEVVQLVAEGHAGRSIAEHMGVSQRTVESHRRNIGEKLGFSDTAGLTRWAMEHRLVPPVL